MKILKGLLSLLWKIYFGIVVLSSIVALYPWLLMYLKNEKYFPRGFKLIKRQARFILFMVGIRYEVQGDLPKEQRSFVICPNHSSYLDILVLYATFPYYFIFLGKKELGNVPLFNIYFKKMNILIDRANAKAAHQSIVKAISETQKGSSIVIFPEGTIPKTAPKLKAFKNGAFKVAIEQHIPILPISFPKNYQLLEDSWKFGSHARPGKAKIVYHDVVEMTNRSDKDLINLREQIKAIIESGLDEH